MTRQDATETGPVNDPCGCFAKSFLGLPEAGLAASHALTGPYVNKPRTGAAGGGPSKGKTSVLSSAAHQVNKRGGKGVVTNTIRGIGRLGSRFIPFAGAGLIAYDSAVFNQCLDECEENECQE